MVSVNELLHWKPASLGEVADVLSKRRKTLVDLQDEIDGGEPPASWVAGAAGRARASHEKLRLRLLDLAAEVSDVTVNLDDAHTRISQAKQDLEDALSAARALGLEVDHATGSVKDPATYTDDELARREAMAVEVQKVASDLDSALMAAQEADLDLAASLRSAAAGKTDGGTGDLAHAAAQTPTRMDDLTPAQLAALLGDRVTIETISAYLELEAEIGSFDFKGKVQGDYKVAADGTTILALHLEGGLGREISVGDSSADVGAGATTDLELKFDSPQEAQEFLRNFKDRAFNEVNGWDVLQGDAPYEVARNVASYVKQQDIESFRTGAYVSASGEFDSPWARGAVEGRAEAYYDWAKDQAGLKLEGSADAELGAEDSGARAAASMAGEIKIDSDGRFDSLTLTGKMSGVMANDRLGIAMPDHTSTGSGLDVQLTVDSKNPALDDIKTALSAGDVDRAKDLALSNGTLVARQTVIEQYKVEDHEVNLGVGHVKAGWGASGETATQIWFREAGHHEILQIDPRSLPVNSGG